MNLSRMWLVIPAAWLAAAKRGRASVSAQWKSEVQGVRVMIPRCVVVALFVSAPALAGGKEPPPKEKLPALLTAKPLEPDAKDDEERKLGKARYNEAVAAVTGYYRHAMLDLTRSFDPVFAMSPQLLRAGLELSETPKSKVTLLEEYLEMTKWLEGNIDQFIKAGAGQFTRSDLHRARYLRLDAEIQLLRARRDADKAKGK